MPYGTAPSLISCGMLIDFDMSRIWSRTASVFTRISAAGTRPFLSARRTRRNEMIALRGREHVSHLSLLVRRIEREDSVYGLRRVSGVQRRKHEVARLGRLERRIERVDVADL